MWFLTQNLLSGNPCEAEYLCSNYLSCSKCLTSIAWWITWYLTVWFEFTISLVTACPHHPMAVICQKERKMKVNICIRNPWGEVKRETISTERSEVRGEWTVRERERERGHVGHRSVTANPLISSGSSPWHRVRAEVLWASRGSRGGKSSHLSVKDFEGRCGLKSVPGLSSKAPFDIYPLPAPLQPLCPLPLSPRHLPSFGRPALISTPLGITLQANQ